MSDNSISRRHYKDDRYTESQIDNADFSSAFATLESLITNYKVQDYSVDAEFKPSAARPLGKRKAEAIATTKPVVATTAKTVNDIEESKEPAPLVKKRDQKAESKQIPSRQSTRIAT